ncbi:PQQ-binding-like beta-propeller repeat protein [Actinoplanes sp. NPDC051346]|uniref:outer membrane protein assembly factor BamB family protein n=1 Tax=Actinoplanes sp. NPDC051346 TaxID=3155048 RepID=UPI00344AE40F
MAAETFGGATVVIDLGLARGEPDEYDTPVGRTVPRWFAPLLIAVIVLLGSAASAAPPPPALSPVLSLRFGPADPFTLTDTGDLLAQSLGRLAAYDLGDGRMRWQARSEAPSYRLRIGGGLVLLRPYSGGAYSDRGTTAVSLADGSARWRRSGSIVTVAGSDTLLAVSTVRSYGPGRRVQGPVEAVDPATGRTRWRVDVPSTAVLLGVPGSTGQPARMLLLHDSRVAAVHDLATGAVLAHAELPAADYGPENPVVSGGFLLLRHPATTGSAVSAYDLTLRQRWTRPAGFAFGVTACGRLACLVGPDGVRAVEVSDGVEAWFRPGWRSVEQHGGLIIAYGTTAGDADPVGIIDPATARVLTDLHGWRPVPGTGGDHLLVARTTGGDGRTMVAIAAPGDARPRPLSDLPAGTGDCQVGSGRLVCRTTSGELMIWAYERKG